MVHVNSALRLAQNYQYIQRTTTRHSAAAASADSAKPQATSQPAASTNTADDFRTLFSGKAAAIPVLAALTPKPAAVPVTQLTSQPAVSTNTAADDFRALFSGKPAPMIPAMPAPPPPPTAQSVFGANPWIANPGGQAPNGVTYGYNPIYFATPATAATVAQMVGGKVVATNAITPFGPFAQNQQNQMVQLPNGKMINAGIIADFYNHGYSQQYINMLVSNEVNDTTT